MKKSRLVKAIYLYMNTYDLPQRTVAEQMKLGQSTFSKFLHGDKVSTETHAKIATWLMGPHTPSDSDPNYGMLK